ncbi:MAG: hypothetical protein AB1481_06120, partial [Candidatus Omnitrophota bacterium]
NIVIFFSKISVSFSKLWVLMFTGMLIGVITGYLIWGLSNNRLLHPDSETLLVNGMLLIYYTVVSAMFFLLLKMFQFIIRVGKKKNKILKS